MRQRISKPPVCRQYFVIGVLACCFLLVGARVVQIQTVELDHLQAQGDARYLRELEVVSQRGKILDRNGQILAVSTPVESVWADPKVFCKHASQWKPMAKLLGIKIRTLKVRCEKRKNAGFMYIERRLPPALAKQVLELRVPGVERQTEYKRYYPSGPVSAHLVGFTDVNDNGQEGLERFYDAALSGEPGRKRVLKDVAGNLVESVESIKSVQHGEDLQISIDQRVQSLASNYLQKALDDHNAVSGSVVVLSIPSGEILAMVNAPQFNPNDRSTLKHGVFRNRAVTDLLEPGSTTKPFTVGMALDSGKVGADTMVDTAPGYHRVGGHTIRDVHNYGEISLFDVIVHSSNVGSAKLAMAFPYDDLYGTLEDVGFGKKVTNLPGEISGTLIDRRRPIEHATLSYGYGFSATPLQLARAYTAFATDGKILPVTLTPQPDGYVAKGQRVFKRSTVLKIREMLEQVATPEGTARKARVARYRIGGKTGTTHKLIDGNYINKRYVSLFAGIAPISNPRFVMVVAVDDPRGKLYYGGDVAAPVFSSLMDDLLRLYNIKPDQLNDKNTKDKTETQVTGVTKSGETA